MLRSSLLLPGTCWQAWGVSLLLHLTSLVPEAQQEGGGAERDRVEGINQLKCISLGLQGSFFFFFPWSWEMQLKSSHSWACQQSRSHSEYCSCFQEICLFYGTVHMYVCTWTYTTFGFNTIFNSTHLSQSKLLLNCIGNLPKQGMQCLAFCLCQVMVIYWLHLGGDYYWVC